MTDMQARALDLALFIIGGVAFGFILGMIL